jgi:tetratricopeptide (TPR) repeat protein
MCGSKDVAQAHSLGGDAPALRTVLESLEVTAERFPHWRGQLQVYRGEYARLLGNLGQAREALEQALAFAPPGENYSWPKAAVPYIDVLVGLGQIKEAVEFAEYAVREAARIAPVYRRLIEVAATLAWAADGQQVRAARHLDQLLSAAEQQGISGITIAVLHEARARVALLSRDADAFERACQGVARVFANHDNPALVARYRKLVDYADRQGFGAHVSSRPPAHSRLDAHDTTDLRQRIEHATPSVRLRRALELLIQHCDGDGGHLFIGASEQVACVASVGEVVSTIELEQFVQNVRSMDTDLSAGVTATDLGLDHDVRRWGRWTSANGAVYDPVPLYSADDAHYGRAVGIAMLRPKGDTLRPADADFLSSIVGILMDSGDLCSDPAP